MGDGLKRARAAARASRQPVQKRNLPVVPAAGDPCPRGCTTDYLRKVPEPLVMNADREVSCPTCWECFGIAP